MKPKPFILLLFILTLMQAHAQIKVSGRIVDFKTGAPLGGSTVTVVGETIGTIADSLGNYNIKILHLNSELVFSNIAYEEYHFMVSKVPSENVNVSLKKATYGLGEIDIHPKKIKELLSLLKCDTVVNNATEDSSFVVVERLFEYPGGLQCLDRLFLTHFMPHINSKEIKPFGKIEIFFTIDSEGNMVNFSVNQNIDNTIMQVINTIIEQLPKCTPATQNGKPVSVNASYILKY